MAPPILALRDINLTFGTTPLFEGAELSIGESDHICLVGRNGSGKSTLLKIAANLIEADSGEVFIQPGTTIRYLPQEPDFSGFKTTLDYAQAGLEAGDNLHQAVYLLEQLGLNGKEKPAQLSGGEGRRAALARVLAAQPDILLLDEPTNHLDIAAIEWLEAYLKTVSSALILISHDRRFLENLSNITVWLSLGKTRRLEKNFKDFERWRDKILKKEEMDAHKHDRKIVREEHWLRYGVTARRKRNVRRLKDLQALRRQRIDRRTDNKVARMTVNEANVSSKLIFEAENISKSFNDRDIIKDFSTRVLRGDRIGFVGQNGSGKTTLLKILMGELQPDKGSIRLGTKLEMVSLDQRRETLETDSSLSDALTGGGSDMVFIGNRQRHVISYMKDFLFQPEQARTTVGVLSGGERGRLMLARAFARPSNILVLDEPTNDLDLETLDLLQELICDYEGTVLLVSHDRDFLDRIVTSTVAPRDETSGIWIEYAGGYSDMLVQKKDVVEVGQERKKKKAANRHKSSGKSKRMTFKDKHSLESLPKKIEELRTKITVIQNQMSDPNYYNENTENFETAVRSLTSLELELSNSEELWLELELKREKIESN